MKKIFYYSLFLTQIFLLSACTLSMEEYVVPEDQQGIEEPHTTVTPFGEATYKYRANVLPLNGEPQDYVVMVNDSVIWFTDNLPEKWTPKPEQLIAANCSEVIPLGLCSKVLDVTRENGMIKVAFEQAEEFDVYEQLVVKVDLEYVVPNLGEDSTSTRSIGRSGFWKNDTTFVDMSLYDRMKNGGTRADGETSETTEWQIQKAIDLPNKKQFWVDLKYTSTDFVVIHQYKDIEKNYQEEWNDNYTERTYDILLGYGNDPESASNSFKSFPANVQEVRGAMNAIRAVGMTDLKDQKVIKQITPEISIPTFPFGILLRFDASVGYTLMGYGHITVKQRTNPHRVGFIYDNGTKRKIDDPVTIKGKEPYLTYDNLYFGGSMDFWVRARLGVGVIVGKGAGVGGVVGAQLQGGVKASLETESLSEYTIVDRENFKFGPYLTLSGFAEGLVKLGPFTFSLGDFTFNPKDLDIPGFPKGLQNMKAVVNNKKTSAKLSTITNEAGVNELSLVADLYFDKLENFSIFTEAKPENQRAAIRIYEGEINQGSTNYVDLYGPDEELKAKKTYKFETLISDLGFKDADNSVFQVVPCIYDKVTGITTEFRNDVYIANPGKPSVSQPKCYQWYGRDLDQETWEYYYQLYGSLLPAKYYGEYAFTAVFDVNNATTIKELGVRVVLRNPQGDKLINKDVKIPFEGLCKSGKYSITMDFIATYKPNSGVKAHYVNVKPYFIDQHDRRTDGAESKYMNFQYPYEREGGPVTAENYVDLGTI